MLILNSVDGRVEFCFADVRVNRVQKEDLRGIIVTNVMVAECHVSGNMHRLRVEWVFGPLKLENRCEKALACILEN